MNSPLRQLLEDYRATKTRASQKSAELATVRADALDFYERYGGRPHIRDAEDLRQQFPRFVAWTKDTPHVHEAARQFWQQYTVLAAEQQACADQLAKAREGLQGEASRLATEHQSFLHAQRNELLDAATAAITPFCNSEGQARAIAETLPAVRDLGFAGRASLETSFRADVEALSERLLALSVAEALALA